MKIPSLINTITDKIKIAPIEFYVAVFVVVGCILGFVGKQFIVISDNNNINPISAQEITRILDSIVEIEKLTFVGTDIANEPIEELTKLDTKNYKPKVKKSDFKGIVNINTASKKELMQLQNIGEKTAESIIEYRKTKSFRRKEDIINVKGIGIKTFEKIKDNIIV